VTIPSRLISDFLSIKTTANIKVETYHTIGQETLHPIITQDVSVDLKGKKVLVVDDVADSGATLNIVLEQIACCHPADIKTAMLFYKPRSSLVPDFFVHTTTLWVLFSWSLFESIGDLKCKWEKEGRAKEEMISLLKEIGVSPFLVNSYFLTEEKNP
jgi:hypoxanthine phosphoribosyltransferase